MNELIRKTMSGAGLSDAARAVRRNRGAAGVDGVGGDEAMDYIRAHSRELREAVVGMRYVP